MASRAGQEEEEEEEEEEEDEEEEVDCSYQMTKLRESLVPQVSLCTH